MLDVVVVGGGVVGALAAWRLASAGTRVALVERDSLGAGASRAAAGILGAQVEMHGEGPLARLGIASRGLYRALADELAEATGRDIGLEWPGSMRVVGADEDEHAYLEAARTYEGTGWQRAAGLEVELLDARALRMREPALGKRYRAAVAFPGDGLVDPIALMDALAHALGGAGVAVHGGRPVGRIEVSSGRAHGVLLDDGTRISTGGVVVCAGAWTSRIPGLPEGLRRVSPIRGQMVEIEVAPTPTRSIVFGAGAYVVPRTDGRVVLGSTMEDVGFAPYPTLEGIRGVIDRATELVPPLLPARLARTWAGLRPKPEGDVPLIGPTPIERLWVASGHMRSGILLAPITADMVVAMVRGSPSPFPIEPFAPV